MADMGQPPPRKSTVQLACGTVKYLHSFETNQLRKSLFFLQPEDVQVSTIAPGTVCGPSSEKGGLSQRLSRAALLKFSISSSLPVPFPRGSATCAHRRPPQPSGEDPLPGTARAGQGGPDRCRRGCCRCRRRCPGGRGRPPAGLRGRAAFPSHRGPLLSAPRDAGPLCRLSSAPARGGEQPLAGRQPPPSPWLATPPSGILLPPLLRVVAQSNLRQRRGSMSGTKYVDSEVGRPGGRSRAAAGARPALRGAEGRDGERGYGERDGTGCDGKGRRAGRGSRTARPLRAGPGLRGEAAR